MYLQYKITLMLPSIKKFEKTTNLDHFLTENRNFSSSRPHLIYFISLKLLTHWRAQRGKFLNMSLISQFFLRNSLYIHNHISAARNSLCRENPNPGRAEFFV